jgi:hypothetical protein
MTLRTDPPGATCTFLRRGAIVATIDATPATAMVPRPCTIADECTGSTPNESRAPMEIVCRKEGYLDLRRSAVVANAAAIEAEAGMKPVACPSDYLYYAFGYAALVGIAVATVELMAPDVCDKHGYYFAYRPVSELVMTPATFATQSACDAFFDGHRARLEAIAGDKVKRIDETCHWWPCGPADKPCRHPYCEAQWARVDEQLHRDLDPILASREGVRIAAP